MNKQDTLRPLDVAVVLGLAASAGSTIPTYLALGERLVLSASTVHQTVQRLQAAGLLHPESRTPNRLALLEFLTHGVRYCFPPSLGAEVLGVPTAHSGPGLSALFDASDAIVWPDSRGTVRGRSLTPLYPGATALPERAPEVYRMLSLVDGIRVGRARERSAAVAELGRALSSHDVVN